MPVAEERTFESAVELTPEQKQANKDYFESRGQIYEHSDDTAAPEGGKPAETPPVEAPPAEKPKEPVAAPPTGTAPVTTAPAPDGEVIDPETEAEWKSAANDREKLSRHQRKKREFQALKASDDKKAQDLIERDRKIAELEGRLAERPAATAPAPATTTPVESPKPVETKPAITDDDLKPKPFDKPKPKAPKLADFKGKEDVEDPYEAQADAMAEHIDKLEAWKTEEAAWDRSEQKRVSDLSTQRDQQQQTVQQRTERVNSLYASGETAFSGFKAAVTQTPYCPVISHLIVDEYGDDAASVAWHLAQPENRALLDDLNRRYNEAGKSGEEVNRMFVRADRELRDFAAKMKAKPKADTPAVVVAEPPKPAPAAAPPVTQQTLPVESAPRREGAPAPAPVKGNSAAADLRPEDIDAMDSDRRRALRRQRGEL